MTIPIVYLGLLPGADTRRISTWQPIIDKMRRKLAAWRRRHLSFSGGICLFLFKMAWPVEYHWLQLQHSLKLAIRGLLARNLNLFMSLSCQLLPIFL
ncbi:hypothetical protein JHK82_053448 [Glycine max]|uniref:Reverse transcriptase zinc-binding domain-containing protein n=2 Tax=Glycine subgen. Soja TaxID=1462606 RepID=K7MY38_SOYBN|nr:hypothetical protein JHK87_053373 [Glycine soja]KAG4927754.1 hypothetical protein JHK85_054240 [Glycine max]KAG5083279.1 hypothetical protein JHK84_053317 [Glycine max]KAG5086051.1 hypothetical protein JHK82_053448 [Glycine max]KAH1077574.1 hypothetical protein GYH30_052887 [Glycine max]